MKIQVVPAAMKPVISNMQESSVRMLPYWIAAAGTALISVIYARIFAWSEELSYHWFHQTPEWVFLLTPLAMVISVLFAHYVAPTAAGSGIPQLLAAVELTKHPNALLHRLLSVRMIVAKFLGSCVCVAGGGVTGREGPMLQISAGIFNLVQKFWPRVLGKSQAPNLQSMILAGGAAGLASAFNTPLGGVIFAIEELAKVHISHIRTYVFHAVIMAGILAQVFLGNYLYFGRIETSSILAPEIFPLIIATAFIGMAGALFGKWIVVVLDWRARLTFSQKLISTIVFGLIVATFSYFFGSQAFGSGRAVIIQILGQTDTPLYLGFVRGITNFFTYTGGVIGGVFAPALSTGAALGSSFSDLLPGMNHQVWALAGMAAFLTGVSRTPFTSLILVLEMTDTHDVIIYLMLASIIAQSAARLIDGTSFYEHMSHRLIHGFPHQAQAASQTASS